MPKTWTDLEVDILKENYNLVTNAELRDLLPNKTDLAIYKKARSLGFRKTKEISWLNRSIARKGEKSNLWRGGRSKTSKGYNLVLSPGHHRADKKGYVLEHILVFEQATGIEIPDSCCIHHLNGKKDDNRIENLCLMTHSAHTVFHHLGTNRSEETKMKMSERKKKI